MNFIPFLMIGGFTVTCRHCSAKLKLHSAGDRFWATIALGGIAIACIWFNFDYPFRLLGQTGTLVLFLGVALLTIVLAMFFAWKDGTVSFAINS